MAIRQTRGLGSGDEIGRYGGSLLVSRPMNQSITGLYQSQVIHALSHEMIKCLL